MCTLYHTLTLIPCRWLQRSPYLLVRSMSVLHGQCYCSWWSGGVRSQDISRYGIPHSLFWIVCFPRGERVHAPTRDWWQGEWMSEGTGFGLLWYVLTTLRHHGCCRWPGTKYTPGHSQAPCWLDFERDRHPTDFFVTGGFILSWR